MTRNNIFVALGLFFIALFGVFIILTGFDDDSSQNMIVDAQSNDTTHWENGTYTFGDGSVMKYAGDRNSGIDSLEMAAMVEATFDRNDDIKILSKEVIIFKPMLSAELVDLPPGTVLTNKEAHIVPPYDTWTKQVDGSWLDQKDVCFAPNGDSPEENNILEDD